MTGNGKCNLTNMSDVQGKYYSSDKASLERIYDTLERFDAAKTREFFRKLGLYTKEKRDGGVVSGVGAGIYRAGCAAKCL